MLLKLTKIGLVLFSVLYSMNFLYIFFFRLLKILYEFLKILISSFKLYIIILFFFNLISLKIFLRRFMKNDRLSDVLVKFKFNYVSN